MKKIACMAICIALLIFFTAPVASAQILDNVWFEVKVKLSGYQVTSENEIFKVNGDLPHIFIQARILTQRHMIMKYGPNRIQATGKEPIQAGMIRLLVTMKSCGITGPGFFL